MTELDDAMEQHMAYLVLSESTSFSYANFLCFEVGAKQYRPTYGTIRNKFVQFKKKGKIVLHCKSNPAFYTLKGYGNTVTVDHTGVTISHNDPVYQMLKNLPMDKASIHDIHLRFNASNIYKPFENTPFPKFKKNQSIAVESWTMNNAITKTTINKNDTVNIILGCSLYPIPLDYDGIIRFMTVLARSEGVLHGLTAMVNNYKIGNESIPPFTKWIITRWDFGRDSIESYNGKKYEIAVEDAYHRLNKIYTKDFGKNKSIRLRAERIDTPRKTVIDAINEKLDLNDTTTTSFQDSKLSNIGTN